jgi:hypothetical protein
VATVGYCCLGVLGVASEAPPPALTDSFIRSLKPNGSARKHFDGSGLFLWQRPPVHLQDFE